MKAKNIISCCKDLVEKHGGTVPRELSELTAWREWEERRPT